MDSQKAASVAGGARRVLVGQFFHETHGFNPIPTTAQRVRLERGDRLIDKARGTGTTLGGIVAKLASLRYAIVPSVGFMAQPSGPIEHAFFERIRDEFLEIVRRERCDAIALDMHGAMCTTELMDADGDLLTRLRAIVGSNVPIGIGLDMHAHVTAAMLRAVDVCIACKESPHTDFPATGERVVECLVAVLDGELRPIHAMAKAPMIHLDAGMTAMGPLAEIKQRAQALRDTHAGIWDVSLYQVYRFSDYDEEKGQTAVVLANAATDRARAAAITVAEDLASWFWTNRERFREELLSIDAALDMVARNPVGRPYALADLGDRVLAGAPGDSIAILERALARKDGLKGAVPITDPSSVAVADSAGIGATITLDIGGRITPGMSPVSVTGKVLHLSDGEFEVTGPVLEGEHTSCGRTAVVLIDDRIHVVLTSEPGLSHTPAAFSSQGIDLRRQDFIVVKSGIHFQANFAGIATPLAVATPGLSFPARGFFPWKNSRFWPEHDMGEPTIRAALFDERAEVKRT